MIDLTHTAVPQHNAYYMGHTYGLLFLHIREGRGFERTAYTRYLYFAGYFQYSSQPNKEPVGHGAMHDVLGMDCFMDA